MSIQIGGARGQARRVRQPSSTERQPGSPGGLTHDLHQCGRGHLRQMADIAEQPIVRGRPRSRLGAQALTKATAFRATDRSVTPSRHFPLGVNSQGRPRKDPGAHARGPARRTAQAVAADERESRRQPRRRDNRALGAAYVGDDGGPADLLGNLSSSAMFCRPARRAPPDPLPQDDQIVGRDVDRMQSHRMLEHVLVVDTDHERDGQICRAASAIDPPIKPRPTIPIFSKIGACSGPGSTGSSAASQILQIDLRGYLIDLLASAHGSYPPSRAARPARGRSAADGRRDDPQFGHQAIELRREHRLRASLSARSGSQCTSMSRPSAPAATAARAIGATLSRRPYHGSGRR